MPLFRGQLIDILLVLGTLCGQIEWRIQEEGAVWLRPSVELDKPPEAERALLSHTSQLLGKYIGNVSLVVICHFSSWSSRQ